MPTAPIATPRPEEIRLHGDVIVDEYAWLERRDDPAVIAHLEAENAYARAALEPLAPLVDALYAEMRGRIPEDDSAVPVRRGPFLYYTRLVAGGQYPLHCRRPAPDGPEELLLDGNALGAGAPFFRVGPFTPSPDHALLAYGVDGTGAGTFTLSIKDTRGGELLPDQIDGVSGSVEWAADGRSLLYVTYDEAHRPFKLFRHRLGQAQAQDELLHHEQDESFFVYLRATRSREYLVLVLHSWRGNEIRYARADDPATAFAPLAPRVPQVEHFLEHQGDHFLILSNQGAENFRLLAAPTADPRPETWRELLAHRPDTLLDGIDAFAGHLVLYERRGGLQHIRICDPDGGNVRYVAFPEPVYTFTPGPNEEYASATLRFTYSSLITPNTVVDYDMATGAWSQRKQDVIPSGYVPDLYVSERLEASAPDGARVPISLVYRRGLVRDGSAPALLIGYGAYGYSYDPAFDQKRLSLLDRGFVFAIAHIRGGQELGRPWYEQGRMLHKKNTFGDFIAAAEQLVAEGYTSPPRLAISGTSAGGLLVSACANARPELFGAVLARVPWTNVIASLIRPDLPLTVIEWDQWGNPAIEEQYRYLRSYDPYEHLEAKAYPPIMATASLNDTAVPYWDPAKWVARLRARKQGDSALIMRTNMAAGHAGSSGRYSSLRDIAEEYAFLIHALGVD
ncbi:S9 family peptidase [Oscillochloris sp. ZM17-4]|uniref:S9 family peptidase n=1 Tax=Oscillochloris sp. ZM17-4 TaxID=2866714 RepID=UPI001C7381C0|nr:S9 family peptidase [Oscillochloris sp. ZM17-4]MBX0328528.1 S9 family peptidase [Oscillochloris sp. ZM17-4]